MNRLKEERKKINKNQSEIAKRLHISQQAYSDYENEDTNPTKDMMIAISKIFGKSINYLFCLEEEQNLKEIEKTNLPEIKQDNLSPLQKRIIEKVKILNEDLCYRLDSYSDRLVEEQTEKQELETKSNL